MKRKLLLSLLGLTMFTACRQNIMAPAPASFNTKSISKSLPATVTNLPITSTGASSTISGWPTSNTTDGNVGTSWSSLTHGSNHTESFYFYFGSFNNVNFIKLTPRFNHGPALGFPVNFSVYYSDGSNWVLSYTYTNFVTPSNIGDHSYPVILALPAVVWANGIQIVATQLGKDNVNNYVFQLAEVGAGYNSDFQHFKFGGNDGSSMVNRVWNAGSGQFDPSKISNWTPDERYPLIAATPGGVYKKNIYAANIVNNGGAWNIYFGGWDQTLVEQDDILVTVSLDNFSTFGPHTRVISHGAMTHVNNESVFKKTDGSWLMTYTNAIPSPQGTPKLNKPGYATSNDGVVWTPNAGTSANLLTMANYPLWSAADVNGSNVVYRDNNGLYHMYFCDFARPRRTHHATSTDNINYTYVNDIHPTEENICTDMKAFTYSGTNYYLMGSSLTSFTAYRSLSTSLSTFPNSATLFYSAGSNDNYITSMGYVAANNRLYGALYGASIMSDLKENSIYAYWLTKKITFVSDETGQTWGYPEKAHGPEQVVLPMDRSFNTGHFNVYDTDGTTLLFTSPQVTIRSGDVWTYTP